MWISKYFTEGAYKPNLKQINPDEFIVYNREILCNFIYFKCIFFRIRNKPVGLEVKKATKEPSGSLTT